MGKMTGDDIMTAVSASAASFWAVSGVAAPHFLHKTLYGGAKNAPPENPHMTRLFGLVVGGGALTPALIPDATTKAKKRLLGAQAAMWLGTGALYAYNASKGIQNKEVCYGIAAAKGALGTACLVQALRKEKKKDAKPAAAAAPVKATDAKKK